MIKGALKIETVFIFVATTAVGWLLYEIFDKLSASADAVGNGIGDAIAPLFVPPPVNLVAGVMLPGGVSVSFNTIVAEGGALKNSGGDNYTFSFRGKNYKVVPPRSADGLYTAVVA